VEAVVAGLSYRAIADPSRHSTTQLLQIINLGAPTVEVAHRSVGLLREYLAGCGEPNARGMSLEQGGPKLCSSKAMCRLTVDGGDMLNNCIAQCTHHAELYCTVCVVYQYPCPNRSIPCLRSETEIIKGVNSNGQSNDQTFAS